jgi:DNA (cytosine-5)-methyltransferase 1
MDKRYTATVQFCGAGGTSEGASQAGVEVVVAINHAPVAIATHAHNHPETQHYCQSMEDCNPLELPATDMLLTSPCCTNHSTSKGQKHYHQFDLFGDIVYDEKSEKSRNTMEDVPRFCKAKQKQKTPYKIVVVENVVEVLVWRKYQDWIAEMKALGYEHKVLSLNSQFFGVPQSRDRVYIVFWLAGYAPELTFMPLAMCQKCEQEVASIQCFKNGNKAGNYRQQYLYHCPVCASEVMPYTIPVSSVLNLDTPGTRISERRKALSSKTLANIEEGMKRYPGKQFLLGYYNNPVYKLTSEPVGTITTVDRWALVTPNGPDIKDASMRMLTPDEVKACMGFPASYTLKGNAKEQVWQAGNAVCPPVMQALVQRCTTALDLAEDVVKIA